MAAEKYVANQEVSELIERIVDINRVAKVVKGGRRFSLSALVAVGDGHGRVGIGTGKAKEANEAIRKASESARKKMVTVKLRKGTIPHDVLSKFGASKVLLIPAAPGTGVIAGGAARTILETAGVQNVLTKIFGSRNSHNVAKAVLKGLMEASMAGDFAKLRGIEREKVYS